MCPNLFSRSIKLFWSMIPAFVLHISSVEYASWQWLHNDSIFLLAIHSCIWKRTWCWWLEEYTKVCFSRVFQKFCQPLLILVCLKKLLSFSQDAFLSWSTWQKLVMKPNITLLPWKHRFCHHWPLEGSDWTFWSLKFSVWLS